MNAPTWLSKTCTDCSLCHHSTQVVVSTACTHNGLLAVGEAPGADEDLKGEGFVGNAGKTLDRLLSVHGVGRFDYGRANVCRCRPPENHKPSRAEINACVPYLASLLLDRKPAVVLTVGATSSNLLLGKGTLSELLIQQKNRNYNILTKNAHPALRSALLHVNYIVPMPHTSPLAFNRNAPDGKKWAIVAAEQIFQACNLLKQCNFHD